MTKAGNGHPGARCFWSWAVIHHGVHTEKKASERGNQLAAREAG
jgi:hypothetical protein